MGKRVQILSSLLLVVTLSGASWAIFHKSEPAYGGKTLSYWLQQYNEVQDMQKFGPADEAIRSLGTNAIPRLLSDLVWHESATVARFSTFWLRHNWIKLPFYGEDRFSGAALMGFKALRSQASPTLPELAKLFEDSRTREKASQALFLVGPACFPALKGACRSTNVATRVQAAVLIAVMESNEIGYAYSWRPAPMNGKPVLYLDSGYGGRAERTISRLVEGLHSQDASVQRANLDALRSIAGSVSNPSPSSLMTWVVGVKEDVNAAREAVRQADAEGFTKPWAP